MSAAKKKAQINKKSSRSDEIKVQVQEIVDFMTSSLETTDRKIEEIKNLCLNKACNEKML